MGKSSFSKDAETLLHQYAKQYAETKGKERNIFYENVEKEVRKLSPNVGDDEDSVKSHIKVCGVHYHLYLVC